MIRRLLVLLVLSAAFAGVAHAQVPSTGRVWGYANLNAQLTPSWGLNVMPGARFEYLRSGAEAKGDYFYELFAGPTWSMRTGDLSLRAMALYYYVGNPVRSKGQYFDSHSLELVPSGEYRFGRFSIADRVIFHNTVYASVYADPAQRRGYGLVLRNLVQAKFAATPELAFMVGDEPFWGVIEDSEAAPHMLGYWKRGLRLNRVYAGFDWRFSPGLSVAPQYIFEQSLGNDGSLAEYGHYLFVVFTGTVRLFEGGR